MMAAPPAGVRRNQGTDLPGRQCCLPNGAVGRDVDPGRPQPQFLKLVLHLQDSLQTSSR